MEIAQDMLETVNSDPDFLNTVIRRESHGFMDMTWKPNWKHPSSSRPKKARQVRRNAKLVLTAFSDSSGLVHHEYAPHDTTMSEEYCQEVLRRFRDAVRRKRSDLWAVAPCYFWLFPKLKMPLKQTRFQTREDIMQNATDHLRAIPKDASNSGRSVGRSVWRLKETILKEISIK